MSVPVKSVKLSACLAVAFVAASCGTSTYFVAREEPWRAQAERACLASGVVRQSPFIRTRSALGGPSVCGAERPFEMAAADEGRVTLQPVALLRCPMVNPVDDWVRRSVVPAARHYFGTDLVGLKVAGSYGCRPQNHVTGAKLSEHGHANALDISGFHLANGRTVTLKSGWHGSPAERDFLRVVHQGACQRFTTVLGPDYDRNHADHFHMDLAKRGRDGTRSVCR